MIIEELAQFIEANSLGVYNPDTDGGDVFLESMPPEPDDAICLYSTPGAPADVSGSLARPGAQIIVRGAVLADVITRAWAIHALFSNQTETRFSVGGTRVMLCTCGGSQPSHIGTDENGRHEYSINLSMITGGD